MVFVENELDLVINEKVQSLEIIAHTITATAQDDISKFLREADFPRHALIVKPVEGPIESIVKGITDLNALMTAFTECSETYGSVVIENDFRAHFSPSRMKVIHQCSKVLAERIASTCPDCSTPGWGLVEPLRGLGCSRCGTRIDWAIHADQYGCQRCERTETYIRPIQTMDPRWCISCNP